MSLLSFVMAGGWKPVVWSTILQLSAARTCYRNIEFPIALVNQEHAVFAVVRDEGQRVDIRIVRRRVSISTCLSPGPKWS